MATDPMSAQTRLAVTEKVANYTVGIAVEKNTGVGTGTLVTDGDDRFILTAAHVTNGVAIEDIRIWFRPNSNPLIAKAAKGLAPHEIPITTRGICVPMVNVVDNTALDISVFKIDPNFVLPDASECYDLRKSQPIMRWPRQILEGVSLLLLGFPVDNSAPVNSLNPSLRFIGTASLVSRYIDSENTRGFELISKTHSPDLEFLFPFTGDAEEMNPKGFSGCGVWAQAEALEGRLWVCDPILIGVLHRFFPKANLIAATKLPAIIAPVPAM